MANNQYVNKVVFGAVSIIDITPTTAVESDVAQGKVFFKADGSQATGTATGGGTGAIVDRVETLPNGADHHIITGVDISDTTAVASDVAQGKYFYDATGTKTAGTASGGSATLITKNITQNGTYNASSDSADGYSSVSVAVPEKTLTTKSITQNGTYSALSDNADGYSSVTVNVSGGGGGGATNVVIGTFTPSADNANTAQDITLEYSGSGYPIYMSITPVEGAYDANGTLYNTVARYGVVMWLMAKAYIVAPTYEIDGDENRGTIAAKYKSSSSTSYSMTNSGGQSNFVYNSAGASSLSGASSCAVLKSNTTLSYFVQGSSYGFIPGIEYRYTVVYSQ